jgi:hypothetical protein
MKKLYLFMTAIMLWPVMLFAQGSTCADPIAVNFDTDLPYADSNQTTCGMGNDYSTTCLGNYDGGEEIVYEFTLTSPMNVVITFNPNGTTYTGIALLDGCPDVGTCVDFVTGSSGTTNKVITTELDPGTYYFIADTWPTPNCIPDFHLNITGTVILCPNLTGLVDSEVLETEVTFNWNDDGNSSWDYAIGESGFDINAATLTNTADTFVTATGLTSGVFYDIYVRTNCGSDQGDWSMISVRTPGPGDNCSMPIVVDLDADLPYADLDQYTCGRGVPYNSSCLGNYDGGESIVYELDLASAMTVKIEMDPNGTTWTGLGLFDACPDVGACIDIQTGSSSAVRTIIAELDAGTYFVMASTYPSPNCIPVLDLTIEQLLCADLSGLGTTGVGETEISFNWNGDGNTSWDYVVDVEGFDVSLATPTNVTDTFATAMSLTSNQFYDVYVRTNCGSDVGDWAMITVKTLGAGDNCDLPIMIDFSSLSYADSNQTTCGRGDFYDQTCMGSYDGGEDIIYELVLDNATDIEITVDPDGSTWYGFGIFDGCPAADNCIETQTQSGSSISSIATQLAAGTYYIMVDTWPSPDCIPNFHITITGTEVTCSNITGLITYDYMVDGLTVSWNSDGNTSWQYAYGETGFDIDTTDLITVTDTFVVITGLSQGVIYDYYIRTDCGLTTSEWTINTGALPPANDQVCNAGDITVDGDAVSVDNTWATYSDISGSCFGGTVGNGDVWLMFEFTPEAGADGVEISTTAGTSDDSRIALYTVTGCPDGPLEFTELACSEDISATDYMSFIAGIALDAGTYYIQCGSWFGTEGSYDVSVTSTTVVPPPVVEGESFEEDTFLPECWTSIDADGDGEDWFQYGAANSAYAGLFSVASASWTAATGALTPDNYLVTPRLALGADEVLNYHVGAQDPAYPAEKYGVYISTTGNEEADFTTELFVETMTTGDWEGRSVDLSAYEGMNVYLAFRHYDVSDEFYLKLDNIILPGEVLTCAVGVEEIEEAKFSIFPNPNNGQFSIINEGQAGKYILEIMDVTGKVVYSEQVQLNANDRTDINTNGINTGVYLVKMTNTDENYYRTMRMVIK